jgi:HK97 family phage portal protein
MSLFTSPLSWFINLFNGEGEGSMTVEKALTSAAFFYGVRKIGNNFSMLPVSLYRERGETRSVQKNHPSHRLLKESPNSYQVPIVFKQQFLNHALLWGDGRAYIHRVNGVPTELIPLMPDRTRTGMIEGRKWHLCKPERDDRFDLLTDMRENPEHTVVIPDEDVLHLMGFTLDGVKGKSLVGMASSTLSIDTGADKHSSSQLKRGYAGGLMLEAPPGAFRKQEDAQEFLETFRKQHEGGDNAGKTAMLREGVKANILAMSNADAQLFESRKFTRQQLALFLGLESILGDDNSVSYNSLEQKILAYLMNCLGAWLTQFEEQAKKKLLTESEQNRGYYFKFNDGALLRSDKAATAEFVSKLMASTVINRNEARAYFDLNPVEGGDEFENPAISVAEKNPSKDGSPAEEDIEEDSNETDAKAATQHIKNLIGVEANRVKAMFKKPNPMEKVEKFYGRWESSFSKRLEDIGIDGELATKHCEESIAALTAISAKNPTDKVCKLVEDCVSTWEERVSLILEGSNRD